MMSPILIIRRLRAQGIAFAVVACCIWGMPHEVNAAPSEPLPPSASLRAQRPVIEKELALLEKELSAEQQYLSELQMQREDLRQELAETIVAVETGTMAAEPKARQGLFGRIFSKKPKTPEQKLRAIQDEIENIGYEIDDQESAIGHLRTKLETQQQMLARLDAQINYVDAKIAAESGSRNTNYHGNLAVQLAQDKKAAFAQVRDLSRGLASLRASDAPLDEIAAAEAELRAAEKEAVRIDRALDHHQYEQMRAAKSAESSQSELQAAYVRLQQLGISMSDAEVAAIVEQSKKPESRMDVYFLSPLRKYVAQPLERGASRVGESFNSWFGSDNDGTDAEQPEDATGRN